jgi:hypothetical protein
MRQDVFDVVEHEFGPPVRTSVPHVQLRSIAHGTVDKPVEMASPAWFATPPHDRTWT